MIVLDRGAGCAVFRSAWITRLTESKSFVASRADRPCHSRRSSVEDVLLRSTRAKCALLRTPQTEWIRPQILRVIDYSKPQTTDNDA